ncbi:ATP-binding protein [Nocardioides lianchengensis]|uniref:Sensor-like histidine kinase SenX3 n=1 Tax=Nocardioides lianchengensis TaxID=1045774 RepID=A0A1G6SR40_9ACTN|nr:ATP-binding protein [Nocardioides lianchengensis]NYG09938.1 signal transduction histidine kinase [Nocardioides lianchengensis]SDD19303.1 His Kinase A (phospho-acceptor) domain-containing protein [Nocardioides lianchengensis]
MPAHARLPAWATRCGFLAAYVAMAFAGRATIIDGQALSLVWPAAGIAVLWFLRPRKQQEWVLDVALLALATLAVNRLTGATLELALIAVVANVGQAAVAAHVLRRRTPELWGVGGRTTFSTTVGLSALLTAALAGSLVGTSAGSLGLALFTDLAGWQSSLLWWGRNLTGILAVTCLVHLVAHRLRFGPELTPAASVRTWSRVPELAMLVVLSLAGYLSAFLQHGMPIAFPLLGLSAWVGLRFSPVVAVAHSIGCGTVAVTLTLHDSGPFTAVGNLEVEAALTQLFVAAVVVVALSLATIRQEREVALARLRWTENVSTARAELWRAVAESTAEGLVVVSADGSIATANDAARALMSRSRTGPVSRVQDLDLLDLDGHRLDARHHPLLSAGADESVGAHDLVVVNADHTARFLSATATGLANIAPYGEGPGAVLLLRDVSEERERRDQLADFASVVAHDLRNPLTALRGWLDIGRDLAGDDPVDPPELQLALGRALEASVRMGALIDDLLADARSEGQQIEPEVLDLLPLVRDAAALHGIADEVVAAHVPAVLADPAMVRQLLHNLVGNAVKYVEPGVVPRIVVAGHAEDGHVVVDISDNGIGVPADQREAIFDKFHRAHAQRAEFSGTGLGLSICRTIVARHGGTIAVLDGPGGAGSTFRITLPAAPADVPAAITAEVTAEVRRLRVSA